MIMKAVIESIEDYRIRVRIPEIHKISTAAGATVTNQLPFATICNNAGIIPAYKVGEIVYVAFENDDFDRPTIIGILQRENTKECKADITADSLTVGVNCILPSDTCIGSTKSSDIENLSNTKGNIQRQIDYLLENVKTPSPSPSSGDPIWYADTEGSSTGDPIWYDMEGSSTGDPIWYADTEQTILSLIFPVGSIYTLTSDANPRDILGLGTWLKIAEKMPIGENVFGSGKALGFTDGSNLAAGFQSADIGSAFDYRIFGAETGLPVDDGSYVGPQLDYSKALGVPTAEQLGDNPENSGLVMNTITVNIWQRIA